MYTVSLSLASAGRQRRKADRENSISSALCVLQGRFASAICHVMRILRHAGARVPEANRGMAVWQRAVLLAAAVAVAYYPVVHAGFVWDDGAALHDNAFLRSLRGLWLIWTTNGRIPNESHYWPVLYTVYWTEFQLWGLNPLGYHVVNVLVHAANAVLLGLLLTRLRVGSAWMAAALFALHPVNVETVAWIHGGKGAWAGLFCLASAYCFFRAEESAANRERLACRLLSLLFLVLALFSKSSSVVLPGGLALGLWWTKRRARAVAHPWLGVLFVVAGCYAFFDSRAAAAFEKVPFVLSFSERVLIASHSLCFYMGKLIAPLGLMTVYPRWSTDPRSWLNYVFPAMVFAVGIVTVLLPTRVRAGFVAGLAWFVGTHLPTLGFVSYLYMRNSFVADRYQYLPAIGMFVVAAEGLRMLQPRIGRPDRGMALSVGLLCLLTALTFRQATHYRDMGTLFSRNVELNPDAPLAHTNLGVALYKAGRLNDARLQLQRTLELDPQSEQALNNLGLISADQGDDRSAVAYYRAALKAGALWPKTMNDLAWHLSTSTRDDLRSATESLELATRAAVLSQFSSAGILDTLAAAQAESGQFDQAVQTAARAHTLACQERDDALARQIERRLATYRNRRPWRE